jgi:hypothetical protein
VALGPAFVAVGLLKISPTLRRAARDLVRMEKAALIAGHIHEVEGLALGTTNA